MKMWSALAEPRRMQIVELLRGGPLGVGDIADRLKMRQPQASKHLRVLHEAGVIAVAVEGNRRICRLQPECFQELHDWLAHYRENWDGTLDKLDRYLQRLKQSDTAPEEPR